jgi:hypothetical protein
MRKRAFHIAPRPGQARSAGRSYTFISCPFFTTFTLPLGSTSANSPNPVEDPYALSTASSYEQ